MNRKLKNTIILAVIFVLVLIGGSLFSFAYQKGEIKAKNTALKELQINQFDTQTLLQQLADLQKRSAELDSILSMRKYNIPANIPQTHFYDFINKVSFNFSPQSFVDILYENSNTLPNYNYYNYVLKGIADFNDLYSLIFAIEQSKQLKKIPYISMINFVKIDDQGMPRFLVNYKMRVKVYFGDNDRFTTDRIIENKLKPNPLYDLFYPLIRNEIPPNMDRLMDVQTGRLLALIPDGAFLTDASNQTFLLWEGDEVYLGYLTEINYDYNEVHFILNKGGIIEKVVLSIEKD